MLKVSVIIPVYNGESFIESCLLSFENQTFKDFEIIVINDGSTDNTKFILEKYKMKSELDIKLIHQKNSGVSAARNNGIQASNGEYICFVDADDMVSKFYLEVLIGSMQKDDIDLVIGNYKIIDMDLTNNSFFENDKSSCQIIDKHQALTKFLYREIDTGVWSMLFKKEIIIKNNIFYANGFRYSEDIHFIYRYLNFSESISILDSEVYLYRINNLSVMSTVGESRLDGFYLMKDLEDYFNVENKEFGNLFEEFGVGRWVSATLWQMAAASESYDQFINLYTSIEAEKYMNKMRKFPKITQKLMAVLFNFSPKIYYIVINFLRGPNDRVYKNEENIE